MATLQDQPDAPPADSSAAEIRLHAIVYQKGEGEDERWVGVCLEHVIWTQARKRDGVLADIRSQIELYLAWAHEDGTEPFAGVPRATERSWDKYRSGSAERIEIVILRTPSPAIELRAAA